MSIRGDLLSADLSNVFQMLALNRKRGRLLIQEQGNFLAQRRLHIAEDRVALDEKPPVRPLPALLVEMGVISYPQYRTAVVRGERYRIDPLHLLRQQSLVTPEHLEAAQRRIQEEEILEVFLWRNVLFTLEEAGEPPKNSHLFSMD